MEVSRESTGGEQVVKITVERHDDILGWYSAGSLSIPLCQLPVLEQALAELSRSQCINCETACSRKIIPFPLMASARELAEAAN